DAPEPLELTDRMASPVLGLFGGADTAITADQVAAFDARLSAAGVDHRIVTYPGAPHSFFDRKAEEFADASAQAWDDIVAVIGAHTAERRVGGASAPGGSASADDGAARVARLDHDHIAGQVDVRGRRDERGLDPRQPRHRIDERQDRRARPGQAGAERAGLTS